MPVSIRVDLVEKGGNSTRVTGTILWDNSYPTGGESIAIDDAQNDVKLERISFLSANGGGYVYGWDAANQKLLVYRDNGTATAAALPQVAATTDLSTLTSAFEAVGQ